MSEILKEILKVNKLIKVLINENDLDGLKDALAEKNKFIKTYGKTAKKDLGKKELMNKINILDKENILNMKKLMKETTIKIQENKKDKGAIKTKNIRLKKYKSSPVNSGRRFDRKK